MGARRGKRAALAFILVTVTLDMLAMSLVIPVLPRLVLQFLGGHVAGASRVIGIFGTVWAVMQFVFSPVAGAVSDRFGRRPVILASNFGLGADYVLMALAPGLALLLVGRIISGITAASMSTASAYIADVLPPERRAGAFGAMSVAFGLGFVVGPALGGILGEYGPRVPFWVAAGLSLANGLYGFFVLPESLAPERRAPFSWRRANPIAALAFLGSSRALLSLAAIFFLYWLAHAALPAVFVLYGTYRYGWDSRTIGFTLAGVGALSALVGGLLVRPVVAALGERRTLLLGLGFGAAAYAVFGLAATPLEFWAGLPLMALMGFCSPALQGLMTGRIAPTAQGRLQGANSSVMAVASMIGPTLFSFVFARAIAGPAQASGPPFPGAPYALAALLTLAALALAVITTTDIVRVPSER